MSERFIDLGNRKWKNPSADKAIKWSISAKGNPYTVFRGFAIVVVEHHSGFFQYMTQPEGKSRDANEWQVHGKFETQDDAKEAAINALRPKREPVPPVDKTATSVITSSGRKIVLDDAV